MFGCLVCPRVHHKERTIDLTPPSQCTRSPRGVKTGFKAWTKLMEGAMRHALGLLGVAAAAVLLVVSGAMNWQFGYSLGKTDFDSQIFGLASAASDGLKALLPFFLFAAIKSRQWSQAAAGIALWTVTLAFSLTSALGFAALNRTDTTGIRAAQVENYKDVRSDLARSRERLSWIPEHRPAGMVQASIDGLKQQRRWRQTSGCSDATSRKSIAFCRGFHQLNAELAAATEAQLVEQKIAQLKIELAKLPESSSQTAADPQATVLARLSGQNNEVVQTGLVILMAILVELGSALGFYVALGQWKIYEDRKPVVVARPRTQAGANDNRTPAPQPLAVTKRTADEAETAAQPAARLGAPENDIERFYRDRVEIAEGCSLTATALYEDYIDWCSDHTKEPLSLPTFGREFGELGVHKAKISGRIRYIGIRLTSVAEEEDGRPVRSSEAA